MKTLRRSLLSLALIAGASLAVEAQTPPPPTPPTPPKPEQPAFEPAGYYELQVTFGGQPVAVVLEMWKENGAWKGSAGNAQLGFTNVTAVTQEGRDLRITLVAENGPTFAMRMNVKADNTVTGTWEGNGDGSPITGKKTK